LLGLLSPESNIEKALTATSQWYYRFQRFDENACQVSGESWKETFHALSNFYVYVGVLILLSIAAFAQVESGRFVGRITDAQGAVIAQVNVSVKNVGTNITQTAITDSDGNYVVTPLSAGTYLMTVVCASGVLRFCFDI